MHVLVNLFLFIGLFLQPFAGVGATDRYVDPRTGIPIIFVSDKDMYPEFWLESPINQKSKPLDTSEIERSKRIILNAMSKYSVRIIRTYLDRIYVTSSLEAYGTPMGGTRSEKRVYVNNSGARNGYTDEYMERTFHHEFSSVLLLNSDTAFNSEVWNSFNDSAFEYGNDEFLAIREGRSGQELDTLLHEQGFLHVYARTSQENDFNSFAELLFLPPPEFIAAVRKYPRLKRKLFYIIDFYTKIDSGYALMKLGY
ncbi:MAG: hypothetical protein ACHQF2_07800 [Flavobacteriales bacterium]